jgi:MFS transporter, DHA2 family, methylenomycin A resistance protein
MTSASFKWVTLTTSLAFVVAQLDVSIINIALPQISGAYHAPITTLQWVIDAYTLAYAVLMLSAGSLSDLLDSKHIFQLGMIIFGVASAGCGFAPDASVLIICRVIQGIGAATMIPSSLSLLNHAFAHQPKTRTRAIGLWTAAGSAAMAAGPTIGGLLIEFINWRFIFFVNIPICITGYLLSFRLQPEQRTHGKKLDIAGQITWMLSITALISVIIEGPRIGFKHFLVWGGLIFSIAVFFIFLMIERKSRHPMLPLHLFKSRAFNALLVLGGVLNCSYYGTVFILSLYLQNVLNYHSLKAGFAFLPLTVGFVISNIFSNRVIDRFGLRKPILAGLIIFAIGFSGLFLSGPDTPYWQLFIPFLTISIGMGMAVPAMINGILSSVDKKLSGTASAILNTSRQTAGAIGVAVFGAMAAGGGAVIISAVIKSATIAVCFTAVAFILVLRVRNMERNHSH